MYKKYVPLDLAREAADPNEHMFAEPIWDTETWSTCVDVFAVVRELIEVATSPSN